MESKERGRGGMDVGMEFGKDMEGGKVGRGKMRWMGKICR